MTATLRVIDFGRVTALRSQTLWHAVAYGVSDGAPPTLSFARPAEPYVSIGYHRRLDEVDLDACREAGLPVYRRMVGGGPVYLDDGQLFFQITLPVGVVPPARVRALRMLLEPAVRAFRTAGVPARLDDDLEIVVGDRKVCGHGAGQIDEAVVVVGNLIGRFDHAAAARVLHAPDAETGAEVARLVRRYVAATSADPESFRSAAVREYARALGLEPRAGALDAREERRLAQLDLRFEDPEWVRGPARPVPPVWRAKIRAGVSVARAADGPTRVTVGLRRDRILQARVFDPGLNGATGAVQGALAGLRLADAGEVLASFGDAGRRLAALVASVEGGTR